jgi:hypothetical protein
MFFALSSQIAASVPVTAPTPNRLINNRVKLNLQDSIASNYATIGSFPMFYFDWAAPTTAVIMQMDGVQTITGNFTYLNLMQRNTSITEARPTINNPNWSSTSLTYLRTTSPITTVTNAGNINITGADWNAVQAHGCKYNSGTDQITGFFNKQTSTGARVAAVVNPRTLSVSTNSTYNKFYSFGVWGFNKILTNDEVDSIRLSCKYPTDCNMFMISPWTGVSDSAYYWNQYNGKTGKKWYFLNTGTTDRPKYSSVVWKRTNNIAAAYNLFYGFTRRGARTLSYNPNNTKGDSVLTQDDVEHLPSAVIWNTAEAMIDFNPTNHAMTMSQADMIFTIFDKSNRTIWKADIAKYKNGQYYKPNSNGKYTQWHWKELNEDFINKYANTGYEGYIYPYLEKDINGNITGIKKVAVYNTNQTGAVKEAIRTKYHTNSTNKKAYLMLIMGNTLANGLHTSWASPEYVSPKDTAKYFHKLSGNYVDYTNIGRFDGRTMTASGTPADPGGDSYRFRDFSPLWNYRGSVASGDQSIGNEHMALIDLGSDADYADGKVFAHAYTFINSFFIKATATNGVDDLDTINWTALKKQNALKAAIREFNYGIDYLEGKGYDVEIIGINLAVNANWTETNNVNSYKTHMRSTVYKLRSLYKQYNSDTIPFITCGMDDYYYDSQSSNANDSFNLAISQLKTEMTNFDYFAYQDLPHQATLYDMRTCTQILQSKYLGSAVKSMDKGYTKPTISNVTISGTKQVGQVVNASYTWGGTASEGETEILYLQSDSMDKASLTYLSNVITGTSYTIPAGASGKYIRVAVFPKDVNKIMNNAYFSPWYLVAP